MRRAVYPWYLGKELAKTIWNYRPIRKMIRARGDDVVEDLVRRMSELFWRDYIDAGTTRSQVLNLFLDDYWEDLWDRVESDARLKRTLARMEAGILKPVPNPVTGSLLNDPGRQAVLAEIRTDAFLRRHPELLEDDDPALSLRRSPEETKKLLATTMEWLLSEKAKRDAKADSEPD